MIEKDFNVFVASSSTDITKVQNFMQSLRGNGYDIIYDWTEIIINEKSMNQEEIDKSMIDDLNAIREADIFIFYQYDNNILSIGSTIEIGAALSLNKPIFILDTTDNVNHLVDEFLNHPYLNIVNGKTINHLNTYPELINNLYKFIENSNCKADLESESITQNKSTHKFEIGDKFVFHPECVSGDLDSKNLFLKEGWVKDSIKQQNKNGDFLIALEVYENGNVDSYIKNFHNSTTLTFDTKWIKPYVDKKLVNDLPIEKFIQDTIQKNEINLFKAIEKDLHKQINYNPNYNLVGHECNERNAENLNKIMNGRKFDDNKLQWDLLPIECIEEIIKTYMYGATIHAEWNWTKVEPPIRRWWNAANRHLSKIRKDEIKNIDDGDMYHAAQAAWNCITILYHHMKGVRWADNKISGDESTKQSTEQTSKKS